MKVTRVSVDVPTRAPTGATNAYVVGQDPAVLVDPAARSDALDDAVADRGVEHVVATHTHPDHVGALAHYADACHATTWARYGRTRPFESATGVVPDRELRDGDDVAGLTAIETPGHAVDHLAFRADDAVLCGDLAVAEGSVVVGHPEGDLRAYLTSLRRLHAQSPSVLHPGHGPAIESPREACERLLAHRLDRERRVLAAVRDGADTVAAVTDAAYDKDLAGVRDLAEATVHAHVQKLVHEGRVRWQDGRVHPVA
ncbi:MBL fold metallo-hydrolase [Halorubellus sp. JP-L1]|uniref:MBL fold metallo-hydrolase n=1 Tax=Halorubellus sp. JP-L1 TaxID=2715753 RepID=UPI00140770F1|nr:MBL fold metallo-hydrolase [Halorubellus sp. JP-L1]NHN42366.1 MBL fold metallo-hydrolase [Halorubellus sp. JP-L1]